MNEHDSRPKPAPGWAEHTVVANLPRLLPGRAAHAPLAEAAEPRTLIGMPRPAPPTPEVARQLGVPFCDVEEPRTVVGEAPSRATAQQLIARYAALSGTTEVPAPPEAGDLAAPVREPWFRRVASFAQDDFRRAPKIVRLLLPALPLVAAATTFLDVDPAAPSLSRAVAVAATGSPAVPAPTPAPAAALALPSSSVTIVRHPGRTLAADAADAAARGERAQAIAIYLQLAREHPDDVVYASAARILMKDEERDRPHTGK
jgi:hypothetical protein